MLELYPRKPQQTYLAYHHLYYTGLPYGPVVTRMPYMTHLTIIGWYFGVLMKVIPNIS